MALKVYELSLEMIREVRPLVEKVATRDRALADQMRRAASSVPLNVAEASQSQGGNTTARYKTAAGSAAEVTAALEVALAWHYIAHAQAQLVLATLDRVRAMLWRLTH